MPTALQTNRSAPHPIDVHVGNRLRQRRVAVGLTQERLARAIGITFQQVQKYERGSNRIVASRLFELARVLQVPVGYFFEDLPAEVIRNLSERTEAEPFERALPDLHAERETLVLVRAYHRINNQTIRRRLIDFLKAIGESGN